MLLSSSIVAGTALVRTVYWVSPIFAVPEGRVRFWALTAFATSSGVSPLAKSFAGSRSTMIWRYLPPAGVGKVTPWIGASRWPEIIEAVIIELLFVESIRAQADLQHRDTGGVVLHD